MKVLDCGYKNSILRSIDESNVTKQSISLRCPYNTVFLAGRLQSEHDDFGGSAIDYVHHTHSLALASRDGGG